MTTILLGTEIREFGTTVRAKNVGRAASVSGHRSSQLPALLAKVCIILAAALGLIGPAFGQSAEWDRIVAAAKKEGKVVIYHIMVPPVVARVKADFEKAYPGIVLEESRVVAAASIARLDQERSTGADGADAGVLAELAWVDARGKEGTLKMPVGPSRNYPADYLIAGGAAPVVQLDPFVMVYNTNIVKSEIKNYRDLLKPEFKGKLGSTEAFSAITLAFYQWLEKTQGADFLPKIASQGIRLYAGAVPATQAVASGEIAVSMYTVTSVVQSLAEKGAPIKTFVPSPNVATSNVAAAFGWAKRPNAGLVFLDYIMSPRGQTVLHGSGTSASPLPGIPGAMSAANINTVDIRSFTPDFVKTGTARFREILTAR